MGTALAILAGHYILSGQILRDLNKAANRHKEKTQKQNEKSQDRM